MALDPKVVDKDLTEIENLLNQLKLEWDKFFGGGSKKPPWNLQQLVEKRLSVYKDTSELSYSQRFRLNTVNGKFTSMKERFDQQLRYRDEGLTAYGKPITAPPIQENFKAKTVTTDEKREDKRLVEYKKLFEEYVEARKKCGESVSQINYDNFSQTIEKQKKQIQEKLKGRDIEFYVSIEDGKVKLKARPK